MTNVRFYTLNALPSWVDATCQGAFINLTAKSGDNEPGLYYGADTKWVRLDNIAQDTTSEIHSASIDTETGIVSFFNSDNGTGDALLTLDISGYIRAEIAKLKTEDDVVIATNTDGVVKIKAGVKEENGVIAQGDGEDITLAKVATTGKAEDITFDAITLGSGESETEVVEEGATLQDVVEGVEEQIAELAGEIDDLTESSKLTLKKVNGDEEEDADHVSADGSTYKLYQGEDEVCSFNIEKDSFVREGSVVYGSMADGEFTESADGEAFIKLIIRESDVEGTTDEKVIYIAAASLVDQIKVKDNDGVEDAEDGTENASTAYLTYDSDTNSLVITNKVKKAIALAETSVQSVNGHSAKEDGKVTIEASDIDTKFEDEDGNALNIDEKFDAVDQAIEDAISSGVNAAEVTESNKNEDDAELGFITADVVPNNDEDATAGKKVTIDVKYGRFAQDANGNLPIDEADIEVAGAEGIATIEEVGRVIIANEAVTAAALNDLNERIGDATEYDEDNKVAKDGTGLTKRVEDLEKRNEEFDPVVTTVEADTAVTGINITVADNTEEGDNDHKYAVKAELVWLTEFPTNA
ncbi:MAG: hypothetical protein MJZ84_08540 [Paludibacteraceae bacterium]|nr:hypothetical protein [Paludibacteraceae bacterium]